jgi:electron-transferring-flavoprotein dehydrogenase
MLSGGRLPSGPLRCGPDHGRTEAAERFYGKRGVKVADIDRGLKYDGERLIQKLDDVYASGVAHDEHQPCHLKITRGAGVCAACWEKYGAPCTAFCPAQVYEMHEGPDGPRLDIAFSNCLHCRTCTIKCPEQNVVWAPPEGGGGPKFTMA